MRYRTPVAAAIAVMVAGLATAAPPKVVTLPNSDPRCFAPWTANTKLFQYPAKKGPYRIALANGYIANTWRIQMIKTAKAYAAQPEVAAKLKEFKVVSTGEDVAAQIAAINNFIDSGYDAIVVNAQNPAAFKPVIKRANDAGVVLVAFDNILDTAQGGDTGVVQAMIDAKHPFVPFGGETENGFRKFCGKYGAQGLKCASAGTGPAQVAVAIKTAIAALEGKVVPQSVKLPLAKAEYPSLKEGTDFYPAQSDNFFVGNSFPTCGINFTAQEIMGQTEANVK